MSSKPSLAVQQGLGQPETRAQKAEHNQRSLSSGLQQQNLGACWLMRSQAVSRSPCGSLKTPPRFDRPLIEPTFGVTSTSGKEED